MDRLQFIGSIDQGNFVSSQDAIIQFFDHTMAAYNLVGQYNGITVCSQIDSPFCMTFKILFKAEDQAVRMADHIMNDLHNRMDLYGKIFNLHSCIMGNTLGIQILQV